MQLGKENLIILQSAKVVKDLIDKRGSIYSSRPPLYVVQDLIADHDHPLFMAYGKQWQKLRKIMHSHFSADRCKNEHIAVQNAEAVEVLYSFLHHPQGWYEQIKRFSTSVVTTLLCKLHFLLFHHTYPDADRLYIDGMRGEQYSNPMVKGIHDAMDD